MSILTFVGALLVLVAGLVAITGIVLLFDHWRTRKRNRIVRAYEGFADADWLSAPTLREKPRKDEDGAPARS